MRAADGNGYFSMAMAKMSLRSPHVGRRSVGLELQGRHEPGLVVGRPTWGMRMLGGTVSGLGLKAEWRPSLPGRSLII